MVNKISKLMLQMKFEQNHEIKPKTLECIVNKYVPLYRNDWQTSKVGIIKHENVLFGVYKTH